MINLTLKQLRYVDALARRRHFGLAASDCAISQPALSMQIRDLEAALGIALFERGPRQIRLTAFGEEFVPRARAILGAVDELGDLARAADGALSGPLRLGIIPTVAPYLAPTIIARLTETYPAAEVRLRETITPRLLAELAEGRLDAAIIALPAGQPGLTEASILTEAFVLVRPEAEGRAPVPDRAALARLPLLLLEEGHCLRDQALSFCEMGGGGLGSRLDGSSLSTLVQMVGAGMGVTLVPEMAAAIEARSAPVSLARFAAPEPCRTIGLVWRQKSPLADHLSALAEILRAIARPTPAA